MGGNLIHKIFTGLRDRYRLINTRRRWIDEEKRYLQQLSFPDLTDDEIDSIRQQWKGVAADKKFFNGHRFYKKIHGFDARYLAMPMYDPLIIRALNPYRDAAVFVNKGFFDIFFADLKQPQLYMKRVDDHYFDCGSRLITKEEAVDMLCNEDRFIIKSSVNSHGGAGIRLVKSRRSRPEIESLLAAYRGDFVVQAIVDQHPDTAKFNPESLNTIRVVSLFLNGRVTVLKAALRCGQNGAEVDNATSGGLMVHIKNDGSLADFGIGPRFEKIVETHNGIKLSGQRIVDFPKLEKIVVSNHPKLYPSLHLIAWDFAIDRDGEPLFIEGNTKVPGIFWIQLCGGPIFGERTEEVIAYVKKRKHDQ